MIKKLMAKMKKKEPLKPFQVESVTDLVKTPDGFDMMVKFNHLPSAIPFHATPNDLHGHGRDLYILAKAGDFGPAK